MTARAARVGVCVGVLLAFGAGCRTEPTPEERIRMMLEQGRQAAVRHDAAALAGFLAHDYRDDRGRDRARMEAWLGSELGRFGALGIYAKPLAIEARHEGRATVTLLVAAAARSRGAESWLDGLEADAQRVELQLVDESGSWKVASARW